MRRPVAICENYADSFAIHWAAHFPSLTPVLHSLFGSFDQICFTSWKWKPVWSWWPEIYFNMDHFTRLLPWVAFCNCRRAFVRHQYPFLCGAFLFQNFPNEPPTTKTSVFWIRNFLELVFQSFFRPIDILARVQFPAWTLHFNFFRRERVKVSVLTSYICLEETITVIKLLNCKRWMLSYRRCSIRHHNSPKRVS